VNIWGILGIGITDDSTAIKSAYAQKLKGCHPEDDPEGFQRLREAYEQALKYIKIRAMIAAEKVKAGISEPADETEDWVENAMDEAGMGDQADPFCRVIHLNEYTDQSSFLASRTGNEEFFESVLTLYEDFYARIDIENWKKVLQADLLWNMKAKEVLRPMALAFFVEHPLLPQSVWRLMDAEFAWSDSSMQLPHDCERALMILLREIDPQWELSFSQFYKEDNTEGHPEDQKNDQIDFPFYAQCRRNLRDAIARDNYVKAEGYYFQAVIVFDKDPDIYRIYFDYLNRRLAEGRILPDKGFHLAIIDRLIKFYPDDHSYLIKRADLCLNLGFYEMAICDYNMLLDMLPDNLEIPFHLAEVYSRIGKKEQKIRYLCRIIRRYSQTQKRLRHNASHSMDNNTEERQIKTNEYVFAQIKSAVKPILVVFIFGFVCLAVIIILLETGVLT